MARINKSQFAILGFLSLQPMSAYEIKQAIRQSVSYFWMESEGQLYPTLKNLFLQKYVSYTEEAAAKGGTKKIYSMTKQGNLILLEWLSKKADRAGYRNELLLKLFFGSNQTVVNNIKLIQADQVDMESYRNILVSIKAGLKQKSLPKERMPYLEMTLDYGIEMLSAEIKWCKDSITRLKKL